MAEEQYVQTIAETVNRTAQFNLSVPVFIAALFEGPDSPLAKWLAAGNEIDTDNKIPRKMIPEFERMMKEKGIPYALLDKEGHSEFVTVATRGPGEYLIDETGEYWHDYDKDRRVVNPFADGKHLGDREEVIRVIQKIDRAYEEKIQKDYILSLDAANKEFDGHLVCSVQNMSFEEACLFQDICSDNFVKTLMRIDPGTRHYSVEFLNEDAMKDSITGLSPVELALQQTLMAEARPEVKDWMEKIHSTDKAIKDYLITVRNPDVKEVNEMVLIQAGNNDYDKLHDNYFGKIIAIDKNKQAEIIDSTEFGHKEVTFLDLNNKEDYDKFVIECADMGHKHFLSKKSFIEASNNIHDYNKLIGINDKRYEDYLKGIDIGKYEAERMADHGFWKTKFIDYEGKTDKRENVRTLDCRVPDSNKIIYFLDKETSDISLAAQNARTYETIQANIEEAKAHLFISNAEEYQTSTSAFYKTAGELAIETKAKEVGFDLTNSSEEATRKFWLEQNGYIIETKEDSPVIIDRDNDGIEDRDDAWIDTNKDNKDDRTEESFEWEEDEEQDEDRGDSWI